MYTLADMERIKKLFSRTQAYEALPDDPDSPTPNREREWIGGRVSKFQYCVFLLLGCAMLWSWNMFMACATYFQRRFADNEFLLNNFQSLILVGATVTNLLSAFYLSRRQASADYPGRISMALIMNCVLTAILALSTVIFIVGPESYIMVVLICVFTASWSTGLCQNGVFAFVNTFGVTYMQAVMTGQGIAGVLPAIAQIVSVLMVPSDDHTASPKSAFAYFLTATFVSGLCLILFLILLSRHKSNQKYKVDCNVEDSNTPPETPSTRKSVSLWTLLYKLKFLSFTIWACFAVTMVFPVYTQAIVSVRFPSTTATTSTSPSSPFSTSSRFFRPDLFIPFGYLIWNLGDLVGRIICVLDMFKFSNPPLLALASLTRVVFIPLYFLCNIKGNGAVINSDLFYWLVQFTFGLSNGWIGSNTMMAAPSLVDEGEREASGGFMGLCLVVGLATGSLASFLVMGA